MLRECITQEERVAYASQPNLEKTKKTFNQTLGLEIQVKIIRYKNENNLEFLEKLITHAEVICKKREDEEYQITQNILT